MVIRARAIGRAALSVAGGMLVGLAAALVVIGVALAIVAL
jgi:hypothetical protein